MIAFPSNHTARSLDEMLRHALAANDEPFEWLVIMHDDEDLLNSLSPSLDVVDAIVVQLPQHEWDFAGRESALAIDRAICQATCKHLILVGHTQAEHRGNAIEAPSVDDNGLTDSPRREGGYGALRARVAQTVARTREAMNHFAQELELLYAIPAVRDKLSSGDLEVHGLVFDAQSGAYLTYDRQNKLFQPLHA